MGIISSLELGVPMVCGQSDDGFILIDILRVVNFFSLLKKAPPFGRRLAKNNSYLSSIFLFMSLIISPATSLPPRPMAMAMPSPTEPTIPHTMAMYNVFIKSLLGKSWSKIKNIVNIQMAHFTMDEAIYP